MRAIVIILSFFFSNCSYFQISSIEGFEEKSELNKSISIYKMLGGPGLETVVDRKYIIFTLIFLFLFPINCYMYK